MGMTALGIVKQRYQEIEPKPFSRFTQVDSEIKENQEWEQRAIKWSEEQNNEKPIQSTRILSS